MGTLTLDYECEHQALATLEYDGVRTGTSFTASLTLQTPISSAELQVCHAILRDRLIDLMACAADHPACVLP